jgi:hypothetical protein
MQNKTSNDTTTLEAEVRETVEQGNNVQEKVRQLTLRVISARSLDIESVRKTAGAVLRGARAGVQKELQHSSAQTHIAREHLKQAVTGLDVALAQFAEAAKLAAQRGFRPSLMTTKDLYDYRAVEREPELILSAARAASYEDPDAVDVLGPAAFPAVATHDAATAAIAAGDVEAFAPRLAAVRESVARHGLRTWSGSMHAAEGTARVVTSSGLDVSGGGTSAGWSATPRIGQN